MIIGIIGLGLSTVSHAHTTRLAVTYLFACRHCDSDSEVLIILVVIKPMNAVYFIATDPKIPSSIIEQLRHLTAVTSNEVILGLETAVQRHGGPPSTQISSALRS